MADMEALARSSAASIGAQAYAVIVPRLEAGHGQLALEAVAAARAGLDVLERQAVAMAREQGSSWAGVGSALGISKQAAQQRFGATTPEPA